MAKVEYTEMDQDFTLNGNDIDEEDYSPNFEIDTSAIRYKYSFKNLPLLYGFCGLACVILSIVGIGFGVTSFMYLKSIDFPTPTSPHNRNSVYIETNFSLIFLLVAGIDIVWKFAKCKYNDRHAISFILLFYCLAQSLCGSTSQLANLNLAKKSIDISRSISLLILHMIIVGVSLSQIYLAVKINEAKNKISIIVDGTNFEHLNVGTKGKLLTRQDSKVFAALTAMSQLTMGMSLGVLLIRSEAQFEKSIKFSDEVGATPWLAVAAGLAVIWHTVYDQQNVNRHAFLMSAIVLQAFCLISTTKFILVPLEVIYVFHTTPRFDINMYGTQLFLSFSLFLCSLAGFYTLIRQYCKKRPTLTENAILQILNDSAIFKHVHIFQSAILLCFCILLWVGFKQLYLYVTDFTPLPFLIVTHIVTSWLMSRRPDMQWHMVNFGVAILCALYAFRDVYIFNYHVAKNGDTHDSLKQVWISNGILNQSNYLKQMESKTALNIGLVMAGLLELLLCLSCCATYLRSALDHYLFVYNKHRFPKFRLKLQILALSQLLCAFCSLFLAFSTFLSNGFTAETYGDHCLYVAVLTFFAAILSLCAAKFTDFVPFALICQVLATILAANFLNFGAFSLRSIFIQTARQNFNVAVDRFGRLPNMNAITYVKVSYVMLIVQNVVSMVQCCVLYAVIEKSDHVIRAQSIDLPS